MLTGDNQLSAHGLNRRLGEIFNPEDIYAEKNPQEKENKLKDLKINDKLNGVWFIGDGLNDAPCARTTTEYGGISCAITADDKASFFANISLNGSLDYLFKHAKITRFLQKNVRQNQGILAYSALVFLAFILCFSISGIAVSPLIPLVIMVSTTLFTLFNSYRSQLTVDNALDKHSTWPKQLLASDLSIGLLMTASSLLICGLLITTVATGGLALPAIVFTAGAVATISSVCLITAAALFGVFALLATTYFVAEKSYNPGSKMHKIEVNTAPSLRVQTQDACLKLTTIPPVSPSNLPEETVTSGFVLATKLF